MTDRFVRQADLVPQARLAEENVTVIGVGAIGRQVALQLAAIGVRKLTLIDFDRVDETNVTTQGYRQREIGMPKVEATRQEVIEIDPTIRVATIEDRFRAKHQVGSTVFCCVDSISGREAIWRQVGTRVRYWCDARMLAETIRVLAVAESQDREHYPTTLFPQAEALSGSCTTKSTIYAAGIAAGLMVHQFARWLRRIPVERDQTLSLLSSELSCG